MKQDEKINRRLAPFGLTVKDLTASELKRAKEEQRAIDKGQMFTDGLLGCRELISLKRRR